MRLYRKALHAIDNHGFRGLMLRALARLRSQPGSGVSFREPDQPHPFDRAHHVDTSGHIPGEELPGNTSSDLYNTAYYAISPSTLIQALERLAEPAGGFAFVDLGCGKGRALLVAARFAFAHIAGVELSPQLCEIARRNTISDPRIAIHHADAATFQYPDAPLVVYLYHPFLAPLLRRVLESLAQQRRDCPHPTYLLYANGRYPKVMARFPSLEKLWEYSLPLSPEDSAADRHGIAHERFALYRANF